MSHPGLSFTLFATTGYVLGPFLPVGPWLVLLQLRSAKIAEDSSEKIFSDLDNNTDDSYKGFLVSYWLSPTAASAAYTNLHIIQPAFSFENLSIVNLNKLSTFNFATVSSIEKEDIENALHEVQAQQLLEELGYAPSLEMILIPGGTFQMGTLDDGVEPVECEQPVHDVKINSFFMSKCTVTQAQWRFVAKVLPKVNLDLPINPSHFNNSNCPVESISWYEAVEFCARLKAFTKNNYRLPTEAEWEYACRAGTSTAFHFGKIIESQFANYDASIHSEICPQGQARSQTLPGGSFGFANAFGLYDMHGNVWEWCQDHWHDNYVNAPNDGCSWLNPDYVHRVIRGGSWTNDAKQCRSASRLFYNPSSTSKNIGFRVVFSEENLDIKS